MGISDVTQKKQQFFFFSETASIKTIHLKNSSLCSPD